MCQTQVRREPGQEERDVGGAAVGKGAFEYGPGSLDLSLLEDEMPEPVLRHDRTVAVSSCVGNMGRFFDAGVPLSKLPKLSQAVN
jgi:hypothetical protein